MNSMKKYLIPVVLTAAVLLLSSSVSTAIESENNVTPEFGSKPNVSQEIVKIDKSAKRKTYIKNKLVNINGASREELNKLPGIGDAEADKIIAGRPYATKAHLVTQNFISRGGYEKIRKLIVAKQPYKDMAKNAALYKNRK